MTATPTPPVSRYPVAAAPVGTDRFGPVAAALAGVGFWPRAALAATAFVTTGLLASSDDGPVLCPIRRCSGGYCPGCGMTRAAGHLLRGDPGASIATHPALIVLVAQFLVLVTIRVTAGRRGVATIAARLPLVLAADITLLIVVWSARMATGTIPVPFAG